MKLSKDALVAEIKRILSAFENSDAPVDRLRASILIRLLSFIDTLEVKEVDLEIYYHEFLQKEWFKNSHVRTISEMMAFTAKHFFELGLKAQKGE